jgi:hypothetical protein
MPKILAGSSDSINSNEGDWAILDIGFAHERSSSCLWFPRTEGEKPPKPMTFDQLKRRLRDELDREDKKDTPLHLLIEAPLSVAFTKREPLNPGEDISANPVGRSFERSKNKTRYWYSGLGCCVKVAAMYLMKELKDSRSSRQIVLYEGFVSFKSKVKAKAKMGKKNQKTLSSHEQDVIALWKAIQTISENLTANKEEGQKVRAKVGFVDTQVLQSAFKVAGMDFGVPPVIVPGKHKNGAKIYY